MNGRGTGMFWVFGHTHWLADFFQDEVRVYSNQRGAVMRPEILHRKEAFVCSRGVEELECTVPRTTIGGTSEFFFCC
jgi:hypothetical protein